MPIANCIISSDCPPVSDKLVDIWASESGVSSEHMTVNLLANSGQLGKKYKIMATLFLPSLWSAPEMSALQLGLAKALSQCFAVPVSEVHIITTIINSGMVVESGQEVTW